MKQKKEQEKEKIKLLLHHNYLQITVKDIKLQLPVRCAKIIKDMYEARNAKNEEKDLLHYSEEGFDNPEYEVQVMIMNAKYGSELQWLSKTIKPLKIHNEVKRK